MILPEPEKQKLAEEVKQWRGRATVADAAKVLGISPRTLNGTEQGRGFNYPTLLRHAMGTLVVPQPEEIEGCSPR